MVLIHAHTYVTCMYLSSSLINVVSSAVGSLGEKSWPPLQPPVTFPSLDYEDEAAEREPMGEGDPQSGDSPTNGAQLDTPTLPGGGDSPNGARLDTEQSMHSEL